jgi:hypothetical protein
MTPRLSTSEALRHLQSCVEPAPDTPITLHQALQLGRILI